MTKPKFGVAYTSAVTRNRICTHYGTKAKALKEAQALHREGARNVECFVWHPDSQMCVAINWRRNMIL